MGERRPSRSPTFAGHGKIPAACGVLGDMPAPPRSPQAAADSGYVTIPRELLERWRAAMREHERRVSEFRRRARYNGRPRRH